MLDPAQINSALGATSMKVWFEAKGMWGPSAIDIAKQIAAKVAKL